MLKRFGLLGESLSHSFSPLIHAELGSYEYCLYEKKPEELEAFFNQGEFDGLNVTIPYKKAVIPFCKELSKTARIIGSVNTIKKMPDGSLYGENTDYYGFSLLLKKTGVIPSKGKTLVLGSGGSSQTVQAVLRGMNSKEVIVVSRNGETNYNNINEHKDAILIINTTPVGMYPNNGSSLISNFKEFSKCRAVIDLIYNPARTELLMRAEECGISACNGLFMLAAQAKRAAEIFTDKTIYDNIIEIIVNKIEQLTLNIVLIGMPGCGKTSIGEALAKKMQRKFADTDFIITQTAGKSVSDVITNQGEDYFRRLETDALFEICKQSGLVIATGGGVVKRPENWRIVRQNSVVVFLQRDLNQLQISGRPLSERNGITALAAERLPIYSKWSDFTIDVSGCNENDVEKAASDICQKYNLLYPRLGGIK